VPLTASEALVAELCRLSFLTLWSEPNPIVRPGKELCDLLVVCAPHVVIFSVKEITFKDTGNALTDWARWQKKAIDESTKQIYGAERWIRRTSRVIRYDGSPGLLLPKSSELILHRVAVALGGNSSVPYQQGDFGKGFAHVLDETSLRVILRELDTITDFVEYLAAKESLLTSGRIPLMQGQEEDLLALYIHTGRRFPQGPDVLIIGDDLWIGLTKKPEWKARKEADRESYVWDRLIETLRELDDPNEPSPTGALDKLETVLRIMARESRFNRRILAQSFNEFMREAAKQQIRARIVPSLSNVCYVFLASARDENRDLRRKELSLRCFVARGLKDFTGDTVVGIATERYVANAGFSLDAVLLKQPEWTKDDQRALEGVQKDLGYFSAPRMKRVTGDEYPVNPVKAGREK
jgi:hypothetical protein